MPLVGGSGGRLKWRFFGVVVVGGWVGSGSNCGDDSSK